MRWLHAARRYAHKAGHKAGHGPGALHVQTPEQLGLEVFGPALFAFMVWLLRHPATGRLDRLYFASREGWALHGLYEAMREHSGIEGLPGATYLHGSRRALLAAQLGASLIDGVRLDVLPLTESSPWFEGSVEELLRARIGFVPARPGAVQASPIVLMRDAPIVHCVAGLLEREIVPHVRAARAGFACYAERLGMLQAGSAGLVDVGYGATMQSAIQKTLSIRLVGFYMAVTAAARKVGAEGGHAFGAFAQGEAAAQFGGAFGLFLEAVLSAPHGQVVGYDDAGEPLFDAGGTSQRAFAVLQRVHDAIRSHCLQRLATHGLQPEADPLAMLRRLKAGSVTLAPGIGEALSVEDAFCGNGEIAVLGTGR